VTPVEIPACGSGQASDRQHPQDAGFDRHLVTPPEFNELQWILATVAENLN